MTPFLGVAPFEELPSWSAPSSGYKVAGLDNHRDHEADGSQGCELGHGEWEQAKPQTLLF